MAKINYFANIENKEAVEKLMTAVSYEGNLMNVDLLDEQIKKYDGIIKNDESLPEEVEAATKKRTKAESDKNAVLSENEKLHPVYTEVLAAVSGAKNEFVQNSETAFRHVLRLSACADNSKFYNLVLLPDSVEFEAFYEAFSALHSNDGEDGSFHDDGTHWAKTIGDMKVSRTLYEDVQGLIKKLFSVPVENDFTRKINVKFGAPEMAALHETFVTDIAVDQDKNKKTGKITVNGFSYKTAITRRQKKDGSVVYEGKRFKGNIAKLAYVRLFK